MDSTEQATRRTPAEAGKEELEQRVYLAARSLFRRKPTWVGFFREILGLNGIVRKCYPTKESLAEFEQTAACAKIQQMLTRLREPSAVITVRLPKTVHDALRAEAHEHRTSMNKLCISKLLQFIDTELVPSDS
jgi:predicted HicB family RNase H-like nuclease